MPKKTVRQFINQATKMLHDQNYNERCIKYDVGVWREFLKFCDKKKHKIYSRSHNEEFITELRNHMPPLKEATLRRKCSAMKKLNLLETRGGWTKSGLNPLQELSPKFKGFLDAQDEHLVKTSHSECSCNTMRKHVSFVLRYFQSIGVSEPNEIKNVHISKYLLTLRGHAKSTIRGELSKLRVFLSYLNILGYTTENLASFVPEYRLGDSQSLVKIWESDEINQVLSVVDNSSPKGKRDYAIIVITAELGIRSRDICNLKLSNLDWERCSISFIQSKTRNPNVLPLSENIGSAIIDYLRVRPKTESEYLFVNLNPPYEKMKTFSSAFQKYVMRSGVKIHTKAHHGLHSLRATVATKLLSAEVSPDVIFSFLGHSDRNSLDHYIRLDVENLRRCALSFEDGELI